MRLLTRLAQGELRLTRIEAFSDGVFAIVVTLLVLELKVPALQDRHSVSELGRQLLELLPKFLKNGRITTWSSYRPFVADSVSRPQREHEGHKQPRLQRLYFLALAREQAQTRQDVAHLLGFHRA